MAIATTLPTEQLLPTPEQQGAVKSLSADKTAAGIDPPAPVMKPGQMSKELIKMAGKSRVQYKVPKKSEDFAFASGKTYLNNEAPTRSSLLMTTKKDPKAAQNN